MPRLYAQNRIAMWQDDDFRKLSDGAQNLYNYLLAHQTMTYAGVADWFPKRIAHVNTNWTAARVVELGRELCAGHFVVIDESTDEVCVRSFMRYEQVLLNPNLVKGALRAIELVESRDLKRVIVHEIGRLNAEEPDLPAWESPDIDALLDGYEPLDGKTISAPMHGEEEVPDLPPDPFPSGSSNGQHTPSETPLGTPFGTPSHTPLPTGFERGFDTGSRLPSNKNPIPNTPHPEPETKHRRTRAKRASDDEDEITARKHLTGLDLDYAEVRRMVAKYTHRDPLPGQVVRIAVTILARKDRKPDKPLAYVVGSIRDDWPVWQQLIDEDTEQISA